MSDIEGKVAKEAMSEWSRRASGDIDGKTERSNGQEHMSQCGQGTSFKRIDTGLTSIECQMLDLTPILRFLLATDVFQRFNPLTSAKR